MKNYDVSLSPDAIQDLTNIYHFIAKKSGYPEVALGYIEKLRDRCYTLQSAPIRGQRRDDIRPNLRILGIAKKAIAAFEVDETQQMVTILNIFYGGEDYEAIMGMTH